MKNKILEPLEDMFFIDVDELFRNIKYIRLRYSSLTHDYMELYKWYFFFQLCLLRDSKMNPIKSNLWNYIVGITQYREVAISYYDFKKMIRENRKKGNY